MEKNVKGYIGLFLGLAAIIAIIIACIPLTKLEGFGIKGEISFYGDANFVIALIGVALAIAAIVFGAMSKKDADKKGPRKPGVIIGIICVIIGILVTLGVGILSTVTTYVNSEGTKGMIADAIKEDDDLRKTIDDLVKGLQESAGAPKTGIPSK